MIRQIVINIDHSLWSIDYGHSYHLLQRHSETDIATMTLRIRYFLVLVVGAEETEG